MHTWYKYNLSISVYLSRLYSTSVCKAIRVSFSMPSKIRCAKYPCIPIFVMNVIIANPIHQFYPCVVMYMLTISCSPYIETYKF
jgi:hypothetical protein